MSNASFTGDVLAEFDKNLRSELKEKTPRA